MQLTRGIYNLQVNDDEDRLGYVLTIGNFDGVHLGHQQVVKALVSKAKALHCLSAVLVFEPQPQELFSPDSAPARLSRLRDKYVLLKQLGVDRLICINFNQKFASLTAEVFIEQLLVKKLAIKHLIVGDDFRFGRKRLGDFAMLKQAGHQYGFSVTDTASHKLSGTRVSSTAIRKCLENDDLVSAKQMLGRAYSIIGKVFHGDKRGREIGFPTANIKLKRRISPVSGVYVVNIIWQNNSYYGMANIGSRPTISGIRQQLEVHIFNFNADLYGEVIEVVLLHKQRAEVKFSSLTELKDQIKQDEIQARAFVNHMT